MRFILCLFFCFTLLAQKPSKDEKRPIDISADQSEYLELENQFIFRGNVFVEDKILKLNCEKLTVKLDAQKQIVKIICDGDVNIRKITAKERLEANADHAVYVIADEKVTLTGDPVLKNGKEILRSNKFVFYRQDNRIETGRMTFVYKTEQGEVADKKRLPIQITADSAVYDDKSSKAVFTGNVKVNDELIFLKSDTLFVSLNAKREVQKTVARGNVVITKEDEQGQWKSNSGVATYYLKNEKIVLADKPILSTNTDKLRSKKIVFYRNSQRIETGKMRFVSSVEKKEGDTTKRAPVTIVANEAKFDQAQNKILFLGDVKVKDEEVTLTSDKLIVRINTKRELQRVTASQNVLITKKQLDGSNWESQSDRAVYDLPENKITLSGNPALKMGNDTLKSPVITFYRNTETITTGNVDIHSQGDNDFNELK